MNSLLLFALFAVNLLTSVLAISVLCLAVWQHPGDAPGRAVIQFLAVMSFYNISVLFRIAGQLVNYPPVLETIAINLSVDGFALCVLSVFSLVVTLAGMMKQANQVLARMGVVAIILLQWPLWTGGFFTQNVPDRLMIEYTMSGLVAAVFTLAFGALTLGAIGAYHRRIGQPRIMVGLVIFLIGQMLTIIDATLREVSFAAIMSIFISTILAYSLVKMQLFSPLVLQTAQLAAIRSISRVLTGPQDLKQVLVTVVQQARLVLKTDIALILTKEDENDLVISAQDGGAVNTVGRHLVIGDSLSGRVFETQQAMRVSSYRLWDGRSAVFDDVAPEASMSVPLLYDYEIVGVLTVAELKEGRLYNDHDQLVLEMLAPQAAVAIANAHLRQRLADAQRYSHAVSDAPKP